jgi:hypothetical protein
MKLVYAVDAYGPNGPIPNSFGMSYEEFFSHYTNTPITRGLHYFTLPYIHNFLNYKPLYAHHTDIKRDPNLYLQQGPILYVVNLLHKLHLRENMLTTTSTVCSWLEYIPKNIIDLWKDKKCKIILFHFWDDVNPQTLDKIVELFEKRFGTSEGFYIWTTALADSVFKKQKNIIIVPYAELWSAYHLPKYYESVDNTKNKKFIKLVRRLTPGRVLSHMQFSSENLNQYGYISIPNVNSSDNSISLIQYAEQRTNSKWRHLITSDNLTSFELDQIPLADTMKAKYNKHWLGFPDKENLINYHHNSYFSIIFESRLEENTESWFYTEKILRAILYKQPFILAGCKSALKYMRQQGYKTFDPYIDETYDTFDNYEDRITEITRVVKDLCSKDLEELTLKCNDIIEHNYKNIFTLINKFKSHIETLHVKSN